MDGLESEVEADFGDSNWYFERSSGLLGLTGTAAQAERSLVVTEE